MANERILHKAGYMVLNAGDGEEALQVARNGKPDIILLDLLLPKLGGREVMQALKQNPLTAQIPILFFSGLPQTNEGRLKDEGAAGYFEKSRLFLEDEVGQQELIRLIEKIVQKSRNEKELGVQTASRGATAGNPR